MCQTVRHAAYGEAVRNIPDPGFAGDDGAADPALAQALRTYADDAHLAPALAVLCTARLLVPVVALLVEPTTDDEGTGADDRDDKGSDMAAVLLTGRDGRRALLAFTGTDTLTTWDPLARPVPVTAAQAATAALDEDAEAVVVDVSGPVRLVVEGDDLSRLAAGERLMPVGAGWAWLPDVGSAGRGW